MAVTFKLQSKPVLMTVSHGLHKNALIVLLYNLHPTTKETGMKH